MTALIRSSAVPLALGLTLSLVIAVGGAAPARAATPIWETGGIGGAIALADTGDFAAGPLLTTMGGDLNIYVLFGGEDARYTAVRAWEINMGTFAPSFLTDSKVGKGKKKVAAEKAAAEADPDAPPPAPKVLVGTPRIKVGGSSWRSERFRAELGGIGLVDLLALAGVPAMTAFLGPTFGGRLQVVYPDGSAAGVGALLLTGGLTAGAALGPSALVRLDSAAEWDPFVLAIDFKAAVLLGLSLNRFDIPLSFRIEGDGSMGPATQWKPSWKAMFSTLLTFD